MFSFQEQGQLFRKSLLVLGDLTGLQLPLCQGAGLPPHTAPGATPGPPGALSQCWIPGDNIFEGWQLLQVCWAEPAWPRGSGALHGALPAQAEGSQTPLGSSHPFPPTLAGLAELPARSQ